MIQLKDNLRIGSGTLRACYLHPGNAELIIKTPLDGLEKGAEANRNELTSYRKLIENHPDLLHISHCYEIIDTNRGEGLVCDCIRDENGRVAQTIWDIVIFQETCDLRHIIDVARSFCDYLIANDIFLFDINLKNIVLQLHSDGSYKPYAIDLKGPYDNHEFLQLSSRIKYLGRKKLRRRTEQLLERIRQFREQRASLRLREHQAE